MSTTDSRWRITSRSGGTEKVTLHDVDDALMMFACIREVVSGLIRDHDLDPSRCGAVTLECPDGRGNWEVVRTYDPKDPREADRTYPRPGGES